MSKRRGEQSAVAAARASRPNSSGTTPPDRADLHGDPVEHGKPTDHSKAEMPCLPSHFSAQEYDLRLLGAAPNTIIQIPAYHW